MEGKRLIKKERKQLRKEERLQNKQQTVNVQMQWKWFLIGAVVMIISGGIGVLLFQSKH